MADGIRDSLFQKFALDIPTVTVSELIEHIRRITEESMILRRQALNC